MPIVIQMHINKHFDTDIAEKWAAENVLWFLHFLKFGSRLIAVSDIYHEYCKFSDSHSRSVIHEHLGIPGDLMGSDKIKTTLLIIIDYSYLLLNWDLFCTKVIVYETASIVARVTSVATGYL